MPRGAARRLLTIAGSDSSGGAGLQADLRTFAAHGCHASCVVTAVTAQGGGGVSAVHAVPPEVVAAQLDAVLADGRPDAIKIGMLASAFIVELVAARLAAWRPVPIVVDPVLATTSGTALLPEEALGPLVERLFPLAALVTPNLPEAARLTGLAPASEGEWLQAARQLAARGCAVLLKGGHGTGSELTDLLLTADGVERFSHPRVEGALRGTGCTLSSAIAVRLARGEPLEAAVRGGIDFLQQTISAPANAAGPAEPEAAPAC